MIAILGWAGSALCVWSLTQKDPGRFRTLNLGACVALIVFDTAIAAWSMALLNLVVAGINVHSLIGLRKAARSGASAVTDAIEVADASTDATFDLDDLDTDLDLAEARTLVSV